LSASAISDADRQKLETKTAVTSPLPPTGCNTFVNTGELIRSTDDSLKQCQVQQNGGTH